MTIHVQRRDGTGGTHPGSAAATAIAAGGGGGSDRRDARHVATAVTGTNTATSRTAMRMPKALRARQSNDTKMREQIRGIEPPVRPSVGGRLSSGAAVGGREKRAGVGLIGRARQRAGRPGVGCRGDGRGGEWAASTS